MFGPRPFRMLAMALIGVMLVVRAGPACAGMLQPEPLVTQAGADTDMDCHGMAGGHERSKSGDRKNVEATCGAACVAVPTVSPSPQPFMSMASVEPDAGRLAMAGMNLAPIPPPPRACAAGFAHEHRVRGNDMNTLKIIGAALALTISGAAAAATADCCKDMACCKDGADCCKEKDGKMSDCCHDMKKGGDHAGHDMSAPKK